MKKTCLRLKKSLKRCLDPNHAAGCSGWTEGPETPDAEALVVVAGVDIGIFINFKGEVPTGKK